MRGRFGWLGLSGVLAWSCAPAPAHEQAPRALSLLHTADIHSRLWPFRSRISSFEAELGLGPAGQLQELGGVARLATRLAAEQRRAPTLWLDSGDALEGAAVFHRHGGRLELELLGGLGLGALALGNHELSLTGAELAAVLAHAPRVSVLSANLEAEAGSPLAGRLLPSTVLEVGGLHVGVVGVSNATSPPGLTSRGNAWGLAPLASTAAVQVAIDDLTGRASFIVVLSHLGLEQDRALVAGTTGIDLLLGGHQHLVSAEPEWQLDCDEVALRAARGCSPRRVPIVHSGAYARWLSRLDLRLTSDDGSAHGVELAELRLQQLPLSATVPLDRQVSARLEQEPFEPQPPLAFLTAPAQRQAALGGDAPLGNWAADTMRAATGADVVVLNTSGLRADLEAGELLRSDLDLAFPFEEPWQLVLADGATLRRALLAAARRSAERGCVSVVQVAGLRLRVRCAECRAGARCVEVLRPGLAGEQPLREDERLLVALPQYLTFAGADFAALAARGTAVDGSIAAALARALLQLPAAREPRECTAALQRLSPGRCREAFGMFECPLSAARALGACRQLPRLEVMRDERIEMLP